MQVRLAHQGDGDGIQAIYAPVVAGTAISFEFEVPDAAEMSRRVAARWPMHPWLVAEDVADGGVLGYAYAGPFSGRAAYDWSVEVSLYVHADARGRGVGRALYTALFAILRLQGFAQAYAGVALPNPASLAIHESFGFVPVGCYRNVGWKSGAWHDVAWFQLPLAAATPPAPVRPLDALAADDLATALRG
jgi:L-amino acid N-acyltransferase YncA